MFNKRKEREADDVATARGKAAARDEELQRLLEAAQTFNGIDAKDVPGLRLHTGAAENVFLCIHRASLIEIADGDDGQPALVDEGEFVVTTTRAAFVGANQVRQWPWTRLVAIDHASDEPWTSIKVSNRRRTFGVRYDDDHRDEIRFGIDLAVAHATGTRHELIRRLTDELNAIRADHACPSTSW